MDEDLIIAPLEPEPESSLAADAVDAVQSGAYNVAAGIAGFVNQAQGGDRNSTMGQISQWGQENALAQVGEMSPGGRAAYGAKFLPSAGEPDIWDEDVSLLQSLGLKVAGTTPSLVASLLPGAVVARVVGAGGLATNLAAAGAQTGGDVWNQIEKGIYDTPDDELQASSEPYREWRADGLSEDEAKAKLAKHAAGAKPLIMAGLTALTAKFGVEGLLARETGEAAGRRAVTGMIGEAAQEGVEGASGEGLTQAGNIAAGTQDELDLNAVWEQVLQGVVLGGATGAAANFAFGTRERKVMPVVEGVAADEAAALGGSSPDAAAPSGPTADAGAVAATAEPTIPAAPAPVTDANEVAAADPDEIEEDTEGLEVAEPEPIAPPAVTPSAEELASQLKSEVNEIITNGVVDPDEQAALADTRPEPEVPGAFDVARDVSAPFAPDPGGPAPDPALAGGAEPAAGGADGPAAGAEPALAPVTEQVTAPQSFDDVMDTLEVAPPEPIMVPKAARAKETSKARTGRVLASVSKEARDAEKQDWAAAPQVRTAGPAAAFVQKDESQLKKLAAAEAAKPGAAPFWGELAEGFAGLAALGPKGHLTKPKQHRALRARIDAAKEAGLAHFAQAAERSGAEEETERETPALSPTKQQEREAREKLKREHDARIQAVFDAHLPGKDEEKALRGLEAGKKALATRLGAMLKAAADAGIAVPAKANKAMTLREKALVEYKRAYQRLQQGRMGPQKIRDFVAFDLAARGGTLDVFWQTAQIEQNARGTAETATNDAGEDRAETTLADRKVAEDFIQSPDEVSDDSSEETDNIDAGPIVVRERPKVEVDVKEAVTAGQNKAGTFQVATVKRRKIMPPRAAVYRKTDIDAAEVFEQLRALARDAEATLEPGQFKDAYDGLNATEKRALHHWMRDPDLEVDLTLADLEAFAQDAVSAVEQHPTLVRQLGSATTVMRNLLRSFANTWKPVRSGTLNNFLDGFNFGSDRFQDGHRRNYAGLVRRLREIVGDVQVHVLSYDDMVAHEMRATVDMVQSGRDPLAPPYGFFDPGARAIVLREDILNGDPAVAADLIIHEALHAAYMHVINSNAQERAQLQALYDHVKATLPWADSYYGMTNLHEFLSEAWTNPEFQEVLESTLLDDATAKGLGLPRWVEKGKSLWLAFLNNVRRALGLGEHSYNAMDGIIRMTAVLDGRRVLMAATGRAYAPPGRYSFGVHASRASDAVMAARDNLDGGSDHLKRLGVKFMTLDQMRQNMIGLFVGPDGADLGQAFVAVLQKIGPRQRQLAEPAEKIAARWADWARQNPAMAVEFADIGETATMLDVDPAGANGHLRATDHQAHHALPKLKERWNKLSPEAKALWRDMAAFYRQAQNELTKQTILNWLNLEPHLTEDQKQDLVARTMAGKLTEADKKLLNNETFKVLKEARGMRVQKGVYFPLMRHGETVVRTKDRLGDLKGGRLVAGTDNLIEFRGATEAEADTKAKAFETATDLVVNSKLKTYYLKGTDTRVASEVALKNHLPAQIKAVDEPVYTDPQTGKRLSKHDISQPGLVAGVDYLVGKQRVFVTSTGQKIAKADVLAQITDVAYRVRVQRDGLYTFDSKAEARRFIRENRRQFEFIDAEPLDRKNLGTRTDLTATQLSGLMSSINARTDMDPNTKALAQGLVREAAVRLMTGNRIQKQQLKRSNVQGASREMGRNLLRYASSWSGALARAEFMPQARELFLAMRRYTAGRFDKFSSARSRYLNELTERFENNQIEPDAPGRLAQTVMQLSFLDKLFSPAYSIINAMQPWMTTYPVLAGRYGAARAALALSKAYVTIGAHRAWGQGLANTGRAGLGFNHIGLDTENVSRAIRQRFARDPEMKALFDLLIERGAMSDDAGLELSGALAQGIGWAGTQLGKIDRVARQLPAAVEAINRAATAVASYELAREKGRTPEAARQEAFDTVMNTQGDYSDINAPRWMTIPALRFAMQFRKYAQMVTYLTFDMVRRATKGQSKAEAYRQLGALGAVQIAMAGALGLPGLEIVKAGAMFAAMFGFGGGWDDLEEEWRRLVAETTGASWEEMLNKGVLTRFIGIDTSSRMSLADVWLYGEPRSSERESIESYLFKLVAGAPGGLLLDLRDAVTHAGKGEFGKAAEKALPVKVVADGIKAFNADDGLLSPTGVVNTVGFKTAAQAEEQRRVSARIRQAQAGADRAKALYDAFKNAKTEGERIKIKSQIRTWNKTAPLKQKVFINKLEQELRTKERARAGS